MFSYKNSLFDSDSFSIVRDHETNVVMIDPERVIEYLKDLSEVEVPEIKFGFDGASKNFTSVCIISELY